MKTVLPRPTPPYTLIVASPAPPLYGGTASALAERRLAYDAEPDLGWGRHDARPHAVAIGAERWTREAAGSRN